MTPTSITLNGKTYTKEGFGYSMKDKEGHLHCDNGPALLIYENAYYFQHGIRHREDGPAMEYNVCLTPDNRGFNVDDIKDKYFLDGKQYNSLGFYEELYRRGIINEEEKDFKQGECFAEEL